jgi:hypothetical protein
VDAAVPDAPVQVAVAVTVQAPVDRSGGIEAVGAVLPLMAVAAVTDAKGTLRPFPRVV